MKRAALIVLLVSGCGDITAPEFTSAPIISPNPNPSAPLAAVVRFAAAELVHTTLSISDGTHSWDIEFDATHNPADGLAIVGMRPDRRHEVRVAIHDNDGNTRDASEPLSYKTPPLPDGPGEFPPLDITTRLADRMEPGITLFSPRRQRPGSLRFGQSFGMLVAVDAAGEVVWYYRTGSRISDLQQLANGNLMYLTQDFRLIEIDLLGNVVGTYYATGRPDGPTTGIPIDTLALHHEVDELPNGNLVILGVEKRPVDNYFTNAFNANAPRKRQQVMGDEVIEITRDGEEVWRWRAFDHLDPMRIGYRTFAGYWSRRGFPDTADWTHANGLLYDPTDDSLLINLRMQSAVAKVDHATGDVRWIIGEPEDWSASLEDKLLTMSGGAKWFQYQHAPVPTPDGTLLLFDNGIYGKRPFAQPDPPGKAVSRAVEYSIDEEKMTTSELWASEARGPEAVVTWAMGDVDWLPDTGNVLVTYGSTLRRDNLEQLTWRQLTNAGSWSRIREYTHTTPPELVWELVLDGGSRENSIGWSIYGADRLEPSAFAPRGAPQ
ncbi:MAG: aryl-sulfate sulfotransferase [bacterium]|nr:aryl-sulfate sulfotransferase [bacterium]